MSDADAQAIARAPRRLWGSEWATQASVCSSTDSKPCLACHECLWWEQNGRKYVAPPDYPNAPKPWESAYRDGRRRYGG